MKAFIQDWRGLYTSAGGWLSARHALNSVNAECLKLGVKTTYGTSGTFKDLLISDDGKRCRGVRCIDGTEWEADLVVLAMGAYGPGLIDLEGQCVSKVCGVEVGLPGTR
jgi:sarcosine oxidase/L-pipecolate oxidase